MLEKVLRRGHILWSVQKDAVRRAAVPPGPAGLLVVGLQALGHVVVNHKGDVGLVDPHTEGVGGHHHRAAVVLKVLLVLPPLLLGQARVVPGGGHPLVPQRLADLVHGGPGGAVDNAALSHPLMEQPGEGLVLLSGPEHVEIEVGPVKARHLTDRVLERQQAEDVLPHRLGGRGGEGSHRRPPGQPLQEVPDFQVAGPEILPPLGDAMGLVHRHQGQGQTPGGGEKGLRLQPLRGHIEDAVGPLRQPPANGVLLLKGQGAVQVGRRDAQGFQGHHLVLHQGNQRGDHQGNPLQQQGGNLVAQGFSPAGGHNAHHVPPGQDAVNKGLLPGPEAVVPEVLFQRLIFVHNHAPSPVFLIIPENHWERICFVILRSTQTAKRVQRIGALHSFSTI